ncbi:MAG: hypothetical protein JWN65_4197 [Solirubrobacterales bacterium]|nr:hypothetical protein [Solirubrobacterales bacterium]
MEVSLTREASHNAIFADSNFTDVIEAAAEHRELMHFIGVVVRRCKRREDLSGTLMGTLIKMVEVRRRPRAQGLVNRLERLYETYNPGNLRGCIIEAMVMERLRFRYQSPYWADNVFLSVNGSYTTTTSIDALGWDPVNRVGEAHDCKARAKDCSPVWLNELLDELPKHGFRVGLATTDSGTTAKEVLKKLGVLKTDRLTVVGPETWWTGLPLQP